MKRSTIITAVVLLLITVGVLTMCYRMNRQHDPVAKAEVCNIKMDMRALWDDHAVWTREVIIAIVDNVPGKADAIARLLKNQDDIGDAIKPYYGDEAGNKLTKLLREHIIIAADVVTFAKAGNKPELEKANVKWYKNATEIAQFLSKANPHLDYADMKYMMDYHLRLTTAEAVSRIQKNYMKNVEDYDKVHQEIQDMSDMIALAIVKQFPDKFCAEEHSDPY
jgi:hypothetical protein